MATLVATPKAIAHALEWRDGENHEQYSKRSSEAFVKLKAQSDALAEGEVVGALIFLPYADGHAIYLVASAKPLRLQHIPEGDAWHVGDATIRGLRLADVQRMVTCDRRLREMFRQKKATKEVS